MARTALEPMMGWIAGEWILVPAIRFDFGDIGRSIQQMTWQQPLYFAVGLAMFVLALRVVPGGWRRLRERPSGEGATRRTHKGPSPPLTRRGGAWGEVSRWKEPPGR